TFILILCGTIIVFLLENKNVNTMGNFTLKDKILNSYFSAVTPRTAGFNTIDFSSMKISTIIFIMLLMFIGASPGGTGGGIKTTTFGIILISVLRMLKGEKQVNVFNRKIPDDIVMRSFTLFFLAISWIFSVSFILSIFEKKDLFGIFFEVISALSTVGLSIAKDTNLSLSSMFSWFGKLLIITTMFFGRLGPLTIGLAIAYRQDKITLKYPEERISVG
ncbi:MAG: potassium transporter TrkG, partial [Endomicrobiia bacterium]